MKEELKLVLKENAKEYYKNAVEAEKRAEYNSSVTLFFKALSSLCDLYILTKEGILPQNHTERFSILRSNHPQIYKILDKNFPFYQDSYRSKLNKEISNMFEEDVKHLFKILNISI